MTTSFRLPDLGEGVHEAEILAIRVTPGQEVREGDIILEIETDKAAMEIDAPAAGTIRDIVGREGVDIAVGSPVAWIYAEGETYRGVAAISSLVGEMPAKPTEGSAVPPSSQPVSPPSALPGISPSRGEINRGTNFHSQLASSPVERERGALRLSISSRAVEVIVPEVTSTVVASSAKYGSTAA